MSVVPFGFSTFAADGDVVDYPELVSSLKNRGPAPKLVGSERLRKPPDNYDWDEQKRILATIQTLIDHVEEAWPSLVDHWDDPEYCITLHESISIDSTRNYSVGRICQIILLESVTAAHLPHQPGDFSAWSKLRWPDMLPDREDRKAVNRWFQQQPEKKQPLYQLQIELCKWAIKKMPTFTAADEELQEEAIAELKKEIGKLNSTKKPAKMKFLIPEFRYVWGRR